MIEKALLEQLIAETHERKVTNYVRRSEFDTALSWLESDEIIVITGVRRCGKSTIVLQLLEEAVKMVGKDNVLYINFEDERLVGLTADDMEQLYQHFIEAKNPSGRVYFFLDEIQEVALWEKWVRRRYEGKDIKFVLTGSNAALLSSELATALTGRNIALELYPFSFQEYLALQGVQQVDSPFFSLQKPRLRSHFKDYVQYGGFPAPALLPVEKRLALLQQYFTNILYRDIVKHYAIRDAKGFEQLLKYLMTNISNPISYYSLRQQFGLSVDTIKEYLSYIQSAYLVYEVPLFSYSLKDQAQKPKKIYAVDTGLRNAVSFLFSPDWGRLYENAVYMELRRRKKEIYYGKTHQEIDFIVKQGTSVEQLINVCSDMNNEKTKERECQGLLRGLDAFGKNEGLMLTDDYMAEEEKEGKKIKFMPIWLWLLGG